MPKSQRFGLSTWDMKLEAPSFINSWKLKNDSDYINSMAEISDKFECSLFLSKICRWYTVGVVTK